MRSSRAQGWALSAGVHWACCIAQGVTVHGSRRNIEEYVDTTLAMYTNGKHMNQCPHLHLISISSTCLWLMSFAISVARAAGVSSRSRAEIRCPQRRSSKLGFPVVTLVLWRAVRLSATYTRLGDRGAAGGVGGGSIKREFAQGTSGDIIGSSLSIAAQSCVGELITIRRSNRLSWNVLQYEEP